MDYKTLFRLLCILTLALVGTPAVAAPLDNSANGKIDEAINVHYLATNFDKAEGLLKGTLKACGDKCSASVKARAWMYIGIVRGAGKQDLEGAAAAFMEAVALDPNVALDRDLSTPELQELFAETAGAGAGGTTDTEDVPLLDDGAGSASAAMGAGAMVCTPDVTEVETRRPIPVACTSDQPVSRVVLYYKEFGAGSWSKQNMGKSGDAWLATIPCSATGIQGTLAWYVVASSSSGEPSDSYGSEMAPVEVSLVNSTAEPAPSYPGQQPPARCMDLAECPEEMRGTPACPGSGGEAGGGGGWGDSCQANSDCQRDLACIDGTCESAPACETDDDCSGGACVNSVCSYGDDGVSAPGPKNFFGIQVGWDLAQMSGSGTCNPFVDNDYACYVGDSRYEAPAFKYPMGSMFPSTTPSTYHNPLSPDYDPRQSGVIGSTLAPSTIRVMLTYERMLSENIGLEGRAGAAFGGSPEAGLFDQLHLEARGKYWFSGTGPGLRLFGILGAGLGQVDAKKAITVAEYGGFVPDANDPNQFVPNPAGDDSPTYQLYCEPYANPRCFLPVTAYKSLGAAFVTGGVGAFLNLGGHGPSVEVNGRIMFPQSGFVVQPTGGWVVGF